MILKYYVFNYEGGPEKNNTISAQATITKVFCNLKVLKLK